MDNNNKYVQVFRQLLIERCIHIVLYERIRTLNYVDTEHIHSTYSVLF